MESLRDAGIQNISLSLDGSDAARHDGFRMVEGTFDKTLQAAKWARAAGLPIQVNTLVTDETLDGPAGRLRAAPGHGHHALEPVHADHDGAGQRAQGDHAGRVREAQRVAVRAVEDGAVPGQDHRGDPLPAARRSARWRRRGCRSRTILRTSVGRGFGIRDGNGIVFINHDGTVNPSGFLPIPLGNVRDLVHRGPVPGPRGHARAAQPGGLQGSLRRVRVLAGLRRIAGTCVRLDGRPARVRSAVPVRPSGRLPQYGMA